jgi:hypothetical protein
VVERLGVVAGVDWTAGVCEVKETTTAEGVAVVGTAAGACEVMVTMTPGDVVGSVTERSLKV